MSSKYTNSNAIEIYELKISLNQINSNSIEINYLKLY